MEETTICITGLEIKAKYSVTHVNPQRRFVPENTLLKDDSEYVVNFSSKSDGSSTFSIYSDKDQLYMIFFCRYKRFVEESEN